MRQSILSHTLSSRMKAREFLTSHPFHLSDLLMQRVAQLLGLFLICYTQVGNLILSQHNSSQRNFELLLGQHSVNINSSFSTQDVLEMFFWLINFIFSRCRSPDLQYLNCNSASFYITHYHRGSQNLYLVGLKVLDQINRPNLLQFKVAQGKLEARGVYTYTPNWPLILNPV